MVYWLYNIHKASTVCEKDRASYQTLGCAYCCPPAANHFHLITAPRQRAKIEMRGEGLIPYGVTVISCEKLNQSVSWDASAICGSYPVLPPPPPFFFDGS